MSDSESVAATPLQLAQLTARIAEAVARAPDEGALVRTVAALPVGAAGLEHLSLELHADGTGNGPRAAVPGGQERPVSSRGTRAGTLRFDVALSDPGVAAPMADAIAALVGGQLDNLKRLRECYSLNQALQIDRVYFERLFSASPEAIVVLDVDDRIMRVNRTFEELFGYPDAEAVGRTINELLVPEEERTTALQLTQDVARGQQVHAETVRRRKDGTLLHVSILGAPIVVQGNQVAVYGIYRDISAQKEAEEALRRLSTTDELTGLYNRRGFFLLAEQQRRLAIRRKAELLLLYIDVDDFKMINDTFGHVVGDRVLADLGNIFRSCFRDSDIVARMGENQSLLARMGGDEFVILAVDAGEHGNDILRNRLHQRVADYNANGSAPCHISLSVGSVSMVPDHTLTIDALIAAADKLMYDSKRQREKS